MNGVCRLGLPCVHGVHVGCCVLSTEHAHTQRHMHANSRTYIRAFMQIHTTRTHILVVVRSLAQAGAAAEAGASVINPNVGRLRDFFRQNVNAIRDPKVSVAGMLQRLLCVLFMCLYKPWLFIVWSDLSHERAGH